MPPASLSPAPRSWRLLPSADDAANKIPRRDTYAPLELVGEVGLVKEAAGDSGLTDRLACLEQALRAQHPQLDLVGMRWHPDLGTERASEPVHAQPRHVSELTQGHRIGGVRVPIVASPPHGPMFRRWITAQIQAAELSRHCGNAREQRVFAFERGRGAGHRAVEPDQW